MKFICDSLFSRTRFLSPFLIGYLDPHSESWPIHLLRPLLHFAHSSLMTLHWNLLIYIFALNISQKLNDTIFYLWHNLYELLVCLSIPPQFLSKADGLIGKQNPAFQVWRQQNQMLLLNLYRWQYFWRNAKTYKFVVGHLVTISMLMQQIFLQQQIQRPMLKVSYHSTL